MGTRGRCPPRDSDLMVYPAGGGSPTLICGGVPPPQGPDLVPPPLSWTPDGRFLYLKFAESMYAIPLQPGQVLPPIPASGFQSKEAVAALPGARLVVGRKRVARSQSIGLCIHESGHAAQHLPGSRAISPVCDNDGGQIPR